MEPVEITPTSGFVMSNSLYNLLKFLVLILFPAIGTLYFAIGSLWGLPNVEQVIGSIAAITAFLGALTGLSTKTYNASMSKYAGSIEMSTNDEGNKVYAFNVQSDPHEWSDKSEVIFKVDSRS